MRIARRPDSYRDTLILRIKNTDKNLLRKLI